MRTVIALSAVLAMGCGGGAKTKKEDGVTRSTRSATYRVRHRFAVTLPELTTRFQAWLPMPQSKDPGQQIREWKVSLPKGLQTRTVVDTKGNEMLLVTGTAKPGTVAIEMQFVCQRWEMTARTDPKGTREHTPAERATLARYLTVTKGVAPEIAEAAKEAVGPQKNPIRVARILYHEVLAHVDHHLKDPNPDASRTMRPSGKGSANYAWEQCTGDSLDLHALYLAMARSVKLPSRLVVGSLFKGPLNGAKQDIGQLCWIEFHAPTVGWIPLDAAVADLYTADFDANEHSGRRVSRAVPERYDGPDQALVEFYFGSLDSRRVVWHRGRDLALPTRKRGAAVAWLPRGHCEVDGKPAAVVRTLSYTKVQGR